MVKKLEQTVSIKGEVFTGVLRGRPLIEKYYPRLLNVLGIKPFRGTLDIKLEKNFDVKPYSEKALEHILMSGHKKVDAYLAHVRLHVRKIKNSKYDCWAMRQANGVYGDDIVEIISCNCLRKKCDLEDGDEVEISFFLKTKPEKKKRKITKLFRRKKKE